MRILIISDIHANLVALETVLKATQPFDAVWCLGDVVGYGPNPNECIEVVRNLPNLLCILGNHDAAALDQIETESFNPEARQAIRWTQERLSKSSKEFLVSLPKKLEIGDVTLSHGSPRYPVWEYLLDTRTATINFEHFKTDFCFVGHTHLPVQYSLKDGYYSAQLIVPTPGETIQLIPRVIINPGSVGQPRDRDPRAAYAFYDTEQHIWEYYRIAYDIELVQARMIEARLPERHIQRLSAGW